MTEFQVFCPFSKFTLLGYCSMYNPIVHSHLWVCNNTSASSSILTFLHQGSLSLDQCEGGTDSDLPNHKSIFFPSLRTIVGPRPAFLSRCLPLAPPPDFPSPIVHWAWACGQLGSWPGPSADNRRTVHSRLAFSQQRDNSQQSRKVTPKNILEAKNKSQNIF